MPICRIVGKILFIFLLSSSSLYAADENIITIGQVDALTSQISSLTKAHESRIFAAPELAEKIKIAVELQVQLEKLQDQQTNSAFYNRVKNDFVGRYLSALKPVFETDPAGSNFDQQCDSYSSDLGFRYKGALKGLMTEEKLAYDLMENLGCKNLPSIQ